MSRTIATLILVAMGLILMATPASALTYVVKLHNGTEFATRYEPEEASFDSSMIIFLSGRGNWMALSLDEVAAIQPIIETLGIGTVIDAVTILIGQSPNDKLSDEEEAELAAEDAAQQLPANYTMPVFSEPNAGGGIPLGFTRMTTPPLGNGGDPLEPSARNF